MSAGFYSGGDTEDTADIGKRPTRPPGSPVLSNQPRVVEAYKTWKYVDCYSDLTTGTRALSTGLSTKNKTVEACLDACAQRGFSKCGVQYHDMLGW